MLVVVGDAYLQFGMLTLRKYPECSLDSFALTGLVEQSILQYVGFSAAGATIDEKEELLFLGQLYGSILA